MYLQQPCNAQNSMSPITAQQIAQQQARVDAVGGNFLAGNDALNSMISSMGGNPAGSYAGGNAGVPTTGPPNGFRWGGPGADVVPGISASGRPSACLIPLVLPMVATGIPLPVPAAVPVPVAAPPPELAPLPVPVPAEDTSICNFSPATVCQAAQAGCFRAGQVDPAQLAACAGAGWGGNLNRFPRLIAAGGWNNGAPVGFINPSPASPAGLSGLGEASNNAGIAGLLMTAAAALYLFDAWRSRR